MEKTRVLVCGGRRFSDYRKLKAVLDLALEKFTADGMTIIQGGAAGADTLANRWAEENGVESITVEADWNKDGRAAGPIRNKKMLDEHAPNAVVAFPGNRGTTHMVKIARERLGDDCVLVIE